MIKQLVRQTGLGIEVEGEADNGEDGCRILQDLKPDILILDMQMPLLDGVELLRFLKEAQPNIQVIVLSGHDDFKYMHQAVRSGVVEYLLKPVDPEQLKQALQLCLAGLEHHRRQISAALVTLPPEMLAAVNDSKRNVATHLNELSAAATEEALTDCIRYLDSHFPCDSGQWLRVYHEFLLTLEHFAAMEGLELNDLLREKDLQARAPSHLNASNVSEVLTAIYREAMDSILTRRRDRKKVNLQQIFDYIQHHYAEGISLESVANRFYVSKVYLSQTYKRQFGENVMEQIIRLRMEAARSWVMQDDAQIKHIAGRVGYEDVSYFHKLFKKHYGISPAEMRLQAKAAAKDPDPACKGECRVE
ncbi:response regulator [Cohnella zeiphila]|uniref:Response regulator n=1 Tax=Cohnella zeiphila TaxID=2761120 RepID=A0A7X0SSH6_9BACL|nr:response regulator [Cohnella zeiphila]MBB6735320.1 response regulator [Cohnella zeiphila]